MKMIRLHLRDISDTAPKLYQELVQEGLLPEIKLHLFSNGHINMYSATGNIPIFPDEWTTKKFQISQEEFSAVCEKFPNKVEDYRGPFLGDILEDIYDLNSN